MKELLAISARADLKEISGKNIHHPKSKPILDYTLDTPRLLLEIETSVASGIRLKFVKCSY